MLQNISFWIYFIDVIDYHVPLFSFYIFSEDLTLEIHGASSGE